MTLKSIYKVPLCGALFTPYSHLSLVVIHRREKLCLLQDLNPILQHSIVGECHITWTGKFISRIDFNNLTLYI